MVRFILIALIAYVAYRIARKVFRSIEPPRHGTGGGIIDEMVQDPQCGTYVPKREARRKVIDGTERHFCSKECEDKFLKGSGGQ